MAVVLKINPGFDASYPWREIGTGTRPEPVSRLDYYLAPADKGGEPAGRWAGRGLATLNFTAGQVIDRDVFEPLYGEHLDPRDPAGKARLGRAAQQFTPEDVIFKELAAAEPHASPARLAELRTLAKAQARHAVPFWDVTVSVSKSITLFYGGLLAAAEQARRSGDAARAEYLERRAGRVWAAIMEGNRAALEFLQDEAGMTRTGYHRGSGTESGAELGKWEHARNWVIGSFRQHTSRDGDPQLHVHNLVLNKVETERDGWWRKLDSRSLYRFQGAAAAIAAAVMETALTREFGVAWVPRADGHGREIAGISQELMDAFSSRRQAITADARAVAAEREAQTGRRPDARQMYRIQKDIAYRTRAAKPETPLDIRAKLRAWEQTARDRDLGELSALPGAVAEAARQARDRERQQAGEDATVREVLRVACAVGWEFARQYGRAPDAEQFRAIERFARFVTLNGADTRPVDPALLLRGWEAQERADAEAQREIRREIARTQARSGAPPGPAPEQARAVAFPAPPRRLSEDQARSVMAEAIAVAQARIPAWTRADLIRYLGETLPAGVLADRRALETLAARAIGGAAGEQVELLSAPEWPRVPDGLRRADGESVFRPHGAERYAGQAQLTLEEHLLAHAREPGAPRLDAGMAARLLGADPERLQAQLQPASAAAAEAGTTGSGLRMDQAAAAWYVLTSPRRAEVMVGPAGTGKTRTAIEMARAWQQAGMGPVVALTASSNARNVLRDEADRRGVAELACYNTAEWLGHAEGAREARDPVALAPGTLITLDEASMMPIIDLAAVLRRAAVHGAKVVVTGDPMQLQAVEGGGGMALLTRHLGHVQLSEASRFRHGWERQATLRLRDGDVTVLTDYRLHDRLHVGPGEDMLEDAARAYLHDRLAGKDTLLMAGTEAMAAELSRRVREDLIRWGVVSDGPAVRLRDGAQASAGDWIMARKNDATTKASQRGRALVNRDILRLVAADPYGTGMSAQVVRLMGREESGRERWSAPFLVSRSYLWNEAQLGYAVTFHASEGRTVDSAIALFSGEEDRQAAYVALSRGRENNEAYVVAGWRIADPMPGPRPAPELARQERLDREHAGLGGAQQARLAREGITAEQVLAQCLGRDGQRLSATDTRAAEWSDADRLDVLGVQWQHVTRDVAEHRYQAVVRAALTEEEARQVLADPAATWLWRTLREAEAAGLDGAAAVRRAVASGPFTDAGSVARVLDWRIRQLTDGMPALAAGSWMSQVPQTGDPDTDRYAAELAEAMTDRQRRLGEHAAEHPPAWAHALGPVPEHPLDRAAWEHKAGQVAAYREMWGWTHPAEPIGPRPGPHSPEARGSWQAAAEALGRQPGDLSEHSDGQLWAWRSSFAREMAWAPRYQGEELAMVRGEIRRAQVDADRARRDAQAADTDEARQRLAERATVAERWEQMTRDVADRLAEVQDGYDAWEAATGPTRDRAVTADAELRRRHPDTRIEPLRAQQRTQPEQVPNSPAGNSATDPPQRPAAAAEPRASRIPASSRDARRPSRMDLVAERLRDISARLDEADLRAARQARDKAAEISSLYLDPDDPDGAPTPAWQSDLRARQRESVRHEPLPRIPAARAVEAEAGLRDQEAAD
jgi:TrwC relaxase/AAA domain